MYQGNIWRASVLFALALVLSGVTAGSAFAADKLRVAKAQAQPFTFAPLDIGIEEGIFAKHNLDIGARVGNVSEEIESKVYDDIMPTFSTNGKFNPKALDTLAQSFVELGTLPTKPDLSKVITEKYLPGAPQ
jgi:hypothetical protein